MSWASELPPDLLCRPLGLVVLTGLDNTYNAVHKAIWDAFCNNRRADRVPLQFKVLNLDHDYPKCRTKRTTYEWYVPKGILKSAWMNKHLDQVPSVVVVFFDLDWDEPLWKEKQMECATRIEIVRNSLDGRSTRVCVVLIQKNAPLPPGEDMVAAERAASFCSACELSAKSLFVLPNTDHLLGYVIRLENAFYEQAQSYYHTEARRVKAHKEFLNKTTHQLLYVRHQFKIAFFNELKQDTHTALKHYKQAYGNVLELRMLNTNMLEVKTVAGFINYKICRLSFQHNAPLDAISQFRKHIDFFKKKIGTGELSFEHSAWMSRQFQIFGDLFDEAIKLGLTAIQTQHPGFYYQQAANHSISRKQLCRGLCHPNITYPSPDPLEGLSSLDYYGQRPWRQGHQSIDPPDAAKEKDGILALQYLESTVDHEWIIIPLLSSAVTQFKKYKSPRMKRYLMVQMGEEYYHAKQYTNALSLLSRVTYDYRVEHWWLLLTNILITSLRCAYLVGNVEEYVALCLELISKYIPLSKEEKTRIQMNLIRVMSSDPPEPEPGCDADCVEKAKPLWKCEASKEQEQCMFTVEMQNIIPFVECKAAFSEETFTADVPIVLHIFLKTTCPFPMRFSKLSVLLNNQVYNQYCVVSDGQGIGSGESSEEQTGDLYLVPGKPKMYTFTYLPRQEDVGKTLQISSIALELGSETSRCSVLHWLHWSDSGSEGLILPAPEHSGKKKKKISSQEDLETVEWDLIDTNSSANLVPRVACVDVNIEHHSPALIMEFYHIKLNIKNTETSSTRNNSLSVGQKEKLDTFLDHTTHVTVDHAEYQDKVVPRREQVPLGNQGVLEPGQESNKSIFVKCLQPGTRTIVIRITYEVDVDVSGHMVTCTCEKEETITIPAVPPFEVTFLVKSMKFEAVESVHADCPFMVLTDINNSAQWPIQIQTSELKLSPFIKNVGENVQSQLESISLKSSEHAGECLCMVAPPVIQPTVPLGNYVIHWKRHGDDTLPSVTTTLPLPHVTLEHIPLAVDVDIPSNGSVRDTLPVTYTIYNKTGYIQEIEVTMDSSELFMLSGHKQLHFRILPSSKYKLNYNLYPLAPGHIPLPRLHLNMLRYPGTMDDIVHKMIPSHVFIMVRKVSSH
ncbi:trafficking protein particle complex subunit 11-like [Lingula anatina]|uniref:Trafficking protein particle complex subunit 11-like n=1 Tax=Lingula anatina TaxID=7574 RepID=A0A1S3GZ96_LINAN|nr:trafficking protein particle complex subunit 11-like [Lingula anatina]|eukprot:XP_013379073.1 trafficking protein particle complex subunit 11-like [Lingula anatina]